MGGPIIFGAAILIIFLLTGKLAGAGTPASGENKGPFPPLPPPGPPGPLDGPPIIPGTKTPISEVEPRDGADFELKRQMVSKAFTSAMQKRAARRPRETKTTNVNTTAAFFRQRGVFIDAPNPQSPPTYYKQPREKMAAHLAEVVNTYERSLDALAPAKKPAIVPARKPTPSAKKPSLTTKPEDQKVALVRKAYSDALVYLIDSLKQRKGVTVQPQQAIVPVSQYFSSLGIPAPDALTAASQFWARSLADISTRVQQAVRYTKQQVDIQTGVAPTPVASVSQLRNPVSGARRRV